MAVYTEVPQDEAAELFRSLNLGELIALRGIQGGIENTNYFATVDREGVEVDYVLTLFERLSADQLPYYLRLMKFLAGRGIPVPEPAANAQGRLVHILQGKPASIVDKLRGHSELAPSLAHCRAVGAMLARMHLVGRDFDMEQSNLRGLNWWNQTAPVVLPHLDESRSALLRSELAYQNHVAATPAYKALPRGPVHADLFRDNVMFEDEQLSGFFDFYFAGNDSFVFDLAVTLNDWCVFHGDADTDGSHDQERAQAMLQAYQTVRPLTSAERLLLPSMLRAGAFRFWLSRLWDWHLPREASMLKPHDPGHFERVLLERVRQASTIRTTLTEDTGVAA